MRFLLISVALLLSGCYPTHWRATPFCQYCLGDKVQELWADGNTNYDKTWANRESLIYA